MIPVRMVLAAEDEQYIEPFLLYVRSSEYSRRMRVQAFSRAQEFLTYMGSSSAQVDIVLAERSFLEAWQSDSSSQVPWICLSEHGREELEGIAQLKYQPLHDLLNNVLEILHRPYEREGKHSPTSSIVIAIYSAAGGSGKSTVAMHLAKQLNSEGTKAFYLNLETFQPGPTIHEMNEDRGLARLLYDLKVAAEQNSYPNSPVSHYTVNDSLLEGDTFGSVQNVNELLEMDVRDTTRLIDYIAESGEYPFIIVDVDSYPNKRTEAVLERCDRLIWLLQSRGDALKKERLRMNQLEQGRSGYFMQLMGKVLFVHNRHLGELVQPIPGSDIIPERTLAYIPEWKEASRDQIMKGSSLFQRDLLKLCRMVRGSMYEQTGGLRP